jgi:predicted metalloprotease with PDZ domain
MRILLAPFFLSALASAQVDYTLAFEPGGKEWKVEARFAGRGEETLDFRFPLWTPGAYHVADFGRFVKELEAADEKGGALAVERESEGHFALSGAAGAKEITIRYRAEPISSAQFSNGIIDVESNRIMEGYAYVNPASLFGFVPGRDQEPVTLALRAPEGWKVATVLARDGEGRFLAPSYYRFEDSPLLFSPTLESAEFSVDGKPHTVSVHGKSAADAQAIADGCRRIVEAGSKLMLGLPYDRYHFLYGFVPEAGGSGLEHSYSTLILLNEGIGIGEDQRSFWDITAHEFFHLWCAERIHVQEIHRPDLTEPLETGTIWVNEGITEYFCRHLLLHAGFLEEEELVAGYLESRGMQAAVGKKKWTDVSRATADWSGMGDIMQFAVRMYVLGPPTIFALDMEMRRATQGERGVLDLLRHLMKEYVARDRGFGEEEFDDILETVAGKPAVDFYGRYVDGDEFPDPTQYLDVLGYGFEGGELESLDPLSEAQAKARRDYFSISGEP